MTIKENQSLLDLLRDHPRKTREIMDELGWDQKATKAKLRELIANGTLKRAGHLYGLSDAAFRPLSPGSTSFRERLTTSGEKTRNYSPASPLIMQRKVAVLEVLRDGKWRSRREISRESRVPDRQLETIIPDLTKSGVLIKIGEEFRDPASIRNKPSTKNECILSILSKPILERNIHDRLGLSEPATVNRLRMLEAQDLVVSKEVLLHTKTSIKTLRFWCSSGRAKQLDDLITRLGPDKDGFVDPQNLPRPSRSARTSRPNRASQPKP